MLCVLYLPKPSAQLLPPYLNPDPFELFVVDVPTTQEGQTSTTSGDLMIWFADDERWMRKRSLASPTPTTPRLLLHLHCRSEAHLFIYLLTGEIYRDEDTDVLSEDRVLENWPDFEESDKAERKQFVDEKVFKK